MFLITGESLRTLVPMADAIDAVRAAFGAVSAGTVWQPPRVVSPDGGTLAMLARNGEGSGAVVKIVSVRANNRSRGLPTVSATVLWINGETGHAEALIDGTALTSLRTGAASGAATSLLAARDATVMAMIGAGGQAADQVRAICAVRNITTIRVAARSHESAKRFVEKLQADATCATETTVLPVDSVEKAIAGADVICCATTSQSPLFTNSLLSERVHINVIGSFRPHMRELGNELLARASIIAIDQREAALEEAGELIQAIEAGAITEKDLIEIGTLFSRSDLTPEGLTVFKSVGIAAQDWSVAELAVSRARAYESLPKIAL